MSAVSKRHYRYPPHQKDSYVDRYLGCTWVRLRIWKCLSVAGSTFFNKFMVEKSTTIVTYSGNYFLFINEVHHIIDGNRLLGVLIPIWYRISFRAQNEMNCKLWRIVKRVMDFNKVENVLIVDRNWRELSTVVGYVRSWKKRVAVVQNRFWRIILQSSKLQLLYAFIKF